MKRRYIILLVFAVTGLGLFSYNYWSYSCGRCNFDTLLTISLPAEILIGVNLLALVVLFYVKSHHHRALKNLTCDCGSQLLLEWHFCPDCGQNSKKTSHK